MKHHTMPHTHSTSIDCTPQAHKPAHTTCYIHNIRTHHTPHTTLYPPYILCAFNIASVKMPYPNAEHATAPPPLLTPPPTHARTHAHTHTHARTHAHTHTRTHTHTHTHTPIPTPTHSLTHHHTHTLHNLSPTVPPPTHTHSHLLTLFELVVLLLHLLQCLLGPPVCLLLRLSLDGSIKAFTFLCMLNHTPVHHRVLIRPQKYMDVYTKRVHIHKLLGLRGKTKAVVFGKYPYMDGVHHSTGMLVSYIPFKHI